NEPCADGVASTSRQPDRLGAQETSACITMHPRGEVLHTCDVQSVRDLLKDAVVIVGALRDEVRVPEGAVQLRSKDVSKPFRDHLFTDGDCHWIPDDTAGRIPHVVVQFMYGNR